MSTIDAATPEADRSPVVAALFVQRGGCYDDDPMVDPWTKERDATLYDGPLPCIAHPPCQLWGPMAAVNFARWGGEHNRPGNDGGCFASALASVRRFGGVLEHPKASRAWAAHGLTAPMSGAWQKTTDGGWVCEVWQSAYGHQANKATWLYYVGSTPPAPMKTERVHGTHQIGGRDQRGADKNKPTISGKRASATPPKFKEALVNLAARSMGQSSNAQP